MSIKPLAKTSEILIQELENELLVYDLNSNKAYCLNETSAIIFQLCDGRKTIAEISDLMRRKLKILVNEDFVWLALNELKRDGLLENADEINKSIAGFNRRDAVKKIGFTSMIAIPLISSVVAPNAIQAASACLQPRIPFCSPNPQPDFNTCLTYLQTNLRPICCSGASGFTDFNPVGGSCCGQCDLV